MYWTDTPSGHLCTRHSVEFLRGEVCHQCVEDPPPAPDGIEQDEVEVSALRGRVKEYRCNSRASLRKANELYGKDEWGNSAKLEDTAIKWARLAEEQQTRLDGYTRDDRLIREDRKMAGLRGGD